MDLLSSGNTSSEVLEGLISYHNRTAVVYDEESERLREEIEAQKAIAREQEAEDVVLPAAENDQLANFFLECVYEQRKSLRP